MQVEHTKEGGVIRLDASDWLASLIPAWSLGDSSTVVANKGLSYARAMDPYRKPGYLMPGYYLTDATTVSGIDAVIRNAVVNSTIAYLVSANAKLHSIDLSTDTVTAAIRTITPHGHANAAGQDVALYTIAGVRKLFYSWNDNADGDVGMFDLSATYVDDYMTTVPAGFSSSGFGLNTPKKMIVGADDCLYISNGNKLAQYDGAPATPTISYNKLILPADFTITSFAKLPNYLVIFGYKGNSGNSFFYTPAKAYFWDYVSADPTYEYDLPGNYADAGFITKSTVGCHVQGRSANIYTNKKSAMVVFNGSGFEVVHTYPDNIPGHGGVQAIDDVVYWNSDGTIYLSGNPHLGKNATLNRITEVNNGTTSGGLCKNLADNKLYCSAGTGTSGGLQITGAGYAPNASFRSPKVALNFPHGFRGKVESVRVNFGATASGGNYFTLTLNTDRGATTTTVFSNLSTVTADSLISNYVKPAAGNWPVFDSLSILGLYSSVDSSVVPPFLESVEVYFKNQAILNK